MMRTGITVEFDTTGEGQHLIQNDHGFKTFYEPYPSHYSLFELLEAAERVAREFRNLSDCDDVYIRRMPYREDEKVTYRFYIA